MLSCHQANTICRVGRFDWLISTVSVFTCAKDSVLFFSLSVFFFSLGRLGQSSCENDEYLCGNGKCVPRSWRCNGLDECGDNTDERICAAPPTPARVSLCPPGTLQCSDIQSTRCLPASLRCNGARDCPDGSDEAHCPDTSCGKRLVNFYGTFASPDFFRPNRSSGTDLHCMWFLDTQV